MWLGSTEHFRSAIVAASLPKPPIPPGLGRHEAEQHGTAPFYGQVTGSSVALDPNAAGASPAGWFVPLAPERWHAPLRPDVSLYSKAELDAGQDELELLREVFGMVLDESGKYPYAVFGQNAWEYRSDPYLTQRFASFRALNEGRIAGAGGR
jgi:hypothetical protein